ncbi:MAG: hypothetical protein ACNS60_16760 [Candidatus Cyclobacteriaceae bacterium M2_1C_046]
MTRIKLYLLLLTALTTVGLSACEDEIESTPEDTSISLSVDTENITENNVQDMVTLTDSRGNQSEPGALASFTSEIEPGAQVIWAGDAQDVTREEAVNVIDIINKNTGDFRLIVEPRRSEDGTQIIADVQDQFIDGVTDEYLIMFTIERTTGDIDTFAVDPILRMINN